MLIRWPGQVKEGEIFNDITSHIDWTPTLLAAANGGKLAEGSDHLRFFAFHAAHDSAGIVGKALGSRRPDHGPNIDIARIVAGFNVLSRQLPYPAASVAFPSLVPSCSWLVTSIYLVGELCFMKNASTAAFVSGRRFSIPS